MARNFIMGIDAKVYYLPLDQGANSDGKPTDFATDKDALVEWCLVQDVTLSLTASTSDVTTRCARGWRQMVRALRDGNPSTTVLWVPSDPAFQLFMGTYMDLPNFNDTVAIAFLDSDKDLADAETDDFVTGLYSEFSIVDFSRNEPLEEAITADFELQLAPTNPKTQPELPEWVNLSNPPTP